MRYFALFLLLQPAWTVEFVGSSSDDLVVYSRSIEFIQDAAIPFLYRSETKLQRRGSPSRPSSPSRQPFQQSSRSNSPNQQGSRATSPARDRSQSPSQSRSGNLPPSGQSSSQSAGPGLVSTRESRSSSPRARARPSTDPDSQALLPPAPVAMVAQPPTQGGQQPRPRRGSPSRPLQPPTPFGSSTRTGICLLATGCAGFAAGASMLGLAATPAMTKAGLVTMGGGFGFMGLGAAKSQLEEVDDATRAVSTVRARARPNARRRPYVAAARPQAPAPRPQEIEMSEQNPTGPSSQAGPSEGPLQQSTHRD